jgi:outer membrane protein assembly factor BamB
MVFDYTGDNYTYSLIFLDPVDGREQRILTPTCPTDEFSSATVDPDSGFLYDEGENSVYLVYDSSPGCIQRLDLASGQPAWQTLDEEWYSFSSGFYGFLTDENLFYSTGNRLVAVEKITGSLEVLMSDEENDLFPLAEADGTLIVRLRRTRGSEKFELRGLDAESGSMLWQKDMGEAKPIDPPDEMAGLIDEGYSGYTWHLGTSGLILVQFQAAPNQLIIQSIDPTDGSQVDEMTIPLKAVSGDFYSVPKVISWKGDLIYMALDGKIYCINYMTGEVVFHFQ